MNRSERILVTGGSGFVGGHLLAALDKAFPDAALISADRGLQRAAPGGPAPRIIHRHLDLAATESLVDFVRESSPTAIVHLAAVAEPARARSAPDEAWRINVDGTRHLAEALRKIRPDALFLYASSSECYGASFNEVAGPITETVPLRPMSTYATTKAAADLAIGQLSYEGLAAIRFRPFNHTGPRQTASYVASAFASQIARIEAGLQPPVLRVGNLDARRDFLDVRDVVAAYIRALQIGRSLPPGEVFNLASGRAISIRHILDTLRTLSSTPIEIEIDPQRVRPNDIEQTLGDASHAHNILGWTPGITLSATLADLLDDWRQRLKSNA